MKRPIDPRRIEVIDHEVADALRKLQPYERVAMTSQAFEMVRALLREKIRTENPGWSDEHVHQELVRVISSGAIPFDARTALRDGVLVMVAKEVEPEAPVEPPVRRPGARSLSN
jgi:hypothetical protein